MIPKIIHYIWFGGDKNPIVLKAIKTWKKNAPDYEIKEWNEKDFTICHLKKIWGNELKIITKNNLINYIEINSSLKDKFKCGVISQQVWSDIIRVNLLEKYGGLWIDSTVILSKRIYALSELFDRLFFNLF